MLPTVVVFGFDSELLFDQYNRLSGPDLVSEHAS